ncbi:unnamed protein product [Didymodactylos carnosus]|uniref:Uncharacterized protein n=1 Tax=Didymodactylos carnosus TaxID=1234261 RepID=A0A815J8F5_9BILA|nr:unnamed protein product [Didymodactylos carnosus]CAF1378612.1 unnamed protein product [Didymodactylos carnosus]CAF3777936.1 unnamed protein product [Didymodactylos carnosus]CAF4271441.1 unnamed protein product [Didymodactylos carnosus]
MAQTAITSFFSSNTKIAEKNMAQTAGKPSNSKFDTDDADDSDLLAAVEMYEKSQTSAVSTNSATIPKSKQQWPISYSSSKQQHQVQKYNKPVQQTTASVSATNAFSLELQYTDFDADSGRLWIYPINYEKRDYQFKIVSEALFKNTLVVLPTGE